MSSSGSFFLMPAGDGGDEAEEDWHRPWSGQPNDELGVAVPLGVVVGRSDTGVVALSHAIAYSEGVYFEFLAVARGLPRAQATMIFHEQHVFGRDELPEGLLRLGLELPGGARASNLGADPRMTADDPEGPVFVQCG